MEATQGYVEDCSNVNEAKKIVVVAQRRRLLWHRMKIMRRLLLDRWRFSGVHRGSSNKNLERVHSTVTVSTLCASQSHANRSTC